MAEPRRKIFRIEQTASQRLAERLDETQAALRHAEIMQEFSALRASLAGTWHSGAGEAPQAAETERLASELHLIRDVVTGETGEPDSRDDLAPLLLTPVPSAGGVTRIARELSAVIDGSEQATQKILAAAEEIDQLAGNLSASLKGAHEQGLARDIQDLVIGIFEACNFQDLTSQRITKVMSTLKFIEDHIARVLQEIKSGPVRATGSDAAQCLHGPRLESDHGHASQGDIDALFGATHSGAA